MYTTYCLGSPLPISTNNAQIARTAPAKPLNPGSFSTWIPVKKQLSPGARSGGKGIGSCTVVQLRTLDHSLCRERGAWTTASIRHSNINTHDARQRPLVRAVKQFQSSIAIRGF